MQAADLLLNSKGIQKDLEAFSTYICYTFVETQNGTVCESAVKIMGDVLLPVVAHSILSADYVCHKLFGFCPSPDYVEHPASVDVARILAGKPDSIKNNDYLNKIYAKIRDDPNPRKIVRTVQISDPHLDFLYYPGSVADCNMPFCCRLENGLANSSSRAAGPWGDLNCDLPASTF